jgi:hypothetical protein
MAYPVRTGVHEVREQAGSEVTTTTSDCFVYVLPMMSETMTKAHETRWRAVAPEPLQLCCAGTGFPEGLRACLRAPTFVVKHDVLPHLSSSVGVVFVRFSSCLVSPSFALFNFLFLSTASHLFPK